MARKTKTVSPTASVGAPSGSVAATAGGAGKPVLAGQLNPRDPSALLELKTFDGRVKSYSANSTGLKLVLKSEADRTFTLPNTAAHYGSVLSMIIAAAAKDEMIVVSCSVRAMPDDSYIAALGLGVEPIVA